MKLAWILGILLLISGLGSSIEAALATADEMEQVCRSWLQYIVDETGGWAGVTDPQITDFANITANDTLLARYYIISPSGYVVVPALKEMAPIKAYSEEYSFGVDDADGFGLMLKQVLQNRFRNYANYYGSLEANQDPGVKSKALFNTSNRQIYDALSSSQKSVTGDLQTSQSNLVGFGPLLKTSWHQGYPYNKFCPTGYGGDTCLVGCVATAAAQIVFHHKWPPFGQGNYNYYWNGDQSCDTSTGGRHLYADFSDFYTYSQYDDDALAELCYEMGVAFDMHYGVCASGAYTTDAADIFPEYFRYEDNPVVAYREYMTQYSWFQQIKLQINRGLPILYRIYSHAIVADGWQEVLDLYQVHMNYGWGGSHNAWYTVDQLYCGWEGCDPMEEAMVINLIPLTGVVILSSNSLSDAAGGDGDNLPEAGETIDVVLKMANYGGGGIANLNMEMFIDDISLNITNGTSSISYIPPYDSADNSADPFQFEIPPDYIPRIDSLYFFLSWEVEGSSKVDTIILEKVIGGSSILLVKDDQSDTLHIFYENNFNKMRIPFDLWFQTGYNDPDSTDLMDYNIVVWFTGDYRPNILNANEISAMKGYLNNGGNLFLTGQNLAAQLATQDPDFLNNYLKADYITTEFMPLVYSLGGGYLFSSADTLCIYGGMGATNQTHPGHISAVNGGIGELFYMISDNTAAVSYAGDHKMIFFAFGFESITSESNKYLNQDSVMRRILDFFEYQIPVNCPQILSLKPYPGDSLNLVDHNPEIHWSYFDPQEMPQLEYQLQVDSDYNWSYIDMWDVGPIASSDTTITYAGGELRDGKRYPIRVRAFNGVLWSAWRYLDIEMNSPPLIPTNLTPDNLQGVIDPTPRLMLDNTIDPNGDQVYYMFELYDDIEMSTMIAKNDSAPQIYPGQTRWDVDVILTDDEDYFWRGRASDGYEPSEWTGLARFWINSENNVPTAFDLIEPSDSIGAGKSPTFVWGKSTDADFYDSIKYNLYYATNPAFFQAISIYDLIDTQYTPASPLTDSLYYWRVIAEDLFSAYNTSDTFSFYTYIRGDANSDGAINVGDMVYLLNFIFKGGTSPEAEPAGDANCDDAVNVGDVVHISYYIFKHGPPPGCEF